MLELERDKMKRTSELNVKESRVLKVMPVDGSMTITQISRKAWPAKAAR